MNRFGEIADELTELIEELDRPNLAVEAAALKVALERAFAKACVAERALRLKQEAEPKPVRRAVHSRRRVVAGSDDGRSGVVIELPLAWRLAVAATRRLND
jgi:hypothetical protein